MLKEKVVWIKKLGKWKWIDKKGEIQMKIGILGAGSIAKTLANTMNQMNSVECYAVAAREYDRAKILADKCGFQKAHGSYEEMLNDPLVELVYIATPHSHHYEHAKLCLEHGKHVLCEKAFMVNAKQTAEILALAKQKNLFITEAIWTRYMPMRKILDDILASGVIGEPTTLTANLGYVIHHIPRLVEPELAGGALLDVGVYPINFALMAFGHHIKNVTSTAVLTDKGVDAQNSITICFEDGKMAVLTSSMMGLSDRQGIIYGTKGFVVVENINNCEGIKVFNLEREEIASYPTPKQISGYEYEIEASIKAIQNGKLECEEMPHEETLRVMKLMDDLRASWGVKYPFE